MTGPTAEFGRPVSARGHRDKLGTPARSRNGCRCAVGRGAGALVGYAPARRGSRVDSATTLRAE